MGTDERLVRHLRLRATSETSIRRATTLFEDALRTASLPDAGARWIFVRRLALGRVEAASSQTLALLLERRIETLRGSCMHGGEAAAGDMPAVWFRDALDAHVQLALRIVRGQPTDAWYWPLAVPAWQRGSAVAEALRDIVLSLARRREAPSALPAWAAILVAAGHAAPLAAGLRPADVPLLLRAAGLPGSALSSGPDPAAHPSSSGTPGAFLAFVPGIGALSPIRDDSRVRLVAALVRVAHAGAGPKTEESRPPIPAPNQGAAVPPERSGSARARSARLPAAAVRSNRPRAGSREVPRDTLSALPDIMPVGGMPARPHIDGLSAHHASVAHAREASAHAGAQATSAGGLLFLVGVLLRLGYGNWLETQPGWAPFDPLRRSLALAAGRLGVPEDDPVWPLVEVPARPARVPSRFVAPAFWQAGLGAGSGEPRHEKTARGDALYDASGRLLLGAWRGRMPPALHALCEEARPLASADVRPADLPVLVAQAWLMAARRWLRRHGGIGLADLVRRPGSLLATPTHVDVFFELEQADLRLRRSGLDLDPGWVPCFGRVVSFHYLRREERW